MKIVKKLEVSENIKEDLLKVCVRNEKKGIIFDREVYEKIMAIRPEEIRTDKIIPIRETRIIHYMSDDRTVHGYDSLNESLIVVYKCINYNLYLLDEIKYTDKVEDIRINYNINTIIKHIALLILKRKV